MTSFIANDFVAKGDPDYLMESDQGYEIRVKKRDTKQVVTLNCSHGIFMDLFVTKYNPKLVWTQWISALNKDGEVIQGKGKYEIVK